MYIEKGKIFLCILIAEQFAYLWEMRVEKKKLSSEFPSPLPRQFSAQNSLHIAL